eukprot:11070788-Alexandrium_andersonii.AAC.1
MSASLVGSEMCIRDSLNTVLEGARGAPTVAGGWRANAGHARGPPARSRAVSYTHLTLPTICSV